MKLRCKARHLHERRAAKFFAYALIPFVGLGTVFADSFHLSSLGTLTVASNATYYDVSDGVLFSAVNLPVGATALQFIVTGSVSTDSTQNLASPDGLYSNGTAPYNFVGTKFSGTYHGTAVGATTGSDPALFGVFFDPSFMGTPSDSLDYRPGGTDLRILATYSPGQNQPFFIGDGSTGNDSFGGSITGTMQTFNIPAGATELLLGIGADPKLSDNGGAGFQAQVFDNSSSTVPEPSTYLLLGCGIAAILLKRGRKRHTNG